MNRFEYVLTTAVAPHQEPLLAIAREFTQAVEQVMAEGNDPVQDPAVLVLGSYIAFHTHADVNTFGGYKRLLSMCEHNVINGPRPN